MQNNQSIFNRFANGAAHLAGQPVIFIAALLLVLVWAGSGPMFRFSDTWQLVINTSTTINTFLMVFLIQNTQNRDTVAIQLKLDELILSVKAARNEMLDVENLDEKEIAKRLAEMVKYADAARKNNGATEDREDAAMDTKENT